MVWGSPGDLGGQGGPGGSRGPSDLYGMVRLAEVIRAGQAGLGGRGGSVDVGAYLIFVIFFTRAKFLENKIYTEKRQFFALNL